MYLQNLKYQRLAKIFACEIYPLAIWYLQGWSLHTVKVRFLPIQSEVSDLHKPLKKYLIDEHLLDDSKHAELLEGIPDSINIEHCVHFLIALRRLVYHILIPGYYSPIETAEAVMILNIIMDKRNKVIALPSGQSVLSDHTRVLL